MLVIFGYLATGITLLEMETGCTYIDSAYFINTANVRNSDKAYKLTRLRIRQVLGQDGTRDLECIEDQYFKDVLMTMLAFDPLRRYTAIQILEDLEAGYVCRLLN